MDLPSPNGSSPGENAESDIPLLTEEQRAELNSRVDRYRQNPSDVIPWDQVRTDLLKKQ